MEADGDIKPESGAATVKEKFCKVKFGRDSREG
jgi:hypothetical protein